MAHTTRRRQRRTCNCRKCRPKPRRTSRRTSRRQRKRAPVGNGPFLAAWAGSGAVAVYLCRQWRPEAEVTTVAMVAVLGGLVAAALTAPVLAGIWRSLTRGGR